MLPYFLMFFSSLFLYGNIRQSNASALNPLSATVPFVLLSLMIGLRFEVGTDWYAYEKALETAYLLPLDLLLERGDPGFQYVNWLVAQLGLRSWAVNLICASVFSIGLLRFCNHQPEPKLALAAALPYLVLVVAMGYSRQATAIGFVMIGLVDLMKGGVYRFVFWMLLGATFHKTAVLLVPLAALAANRNKFVTYPLLAVMGAFAYLFLLRDSVDTLVTNYQGYDSQGTLIRLLMTLIPALLFLKRGRLLQLDQTEYRFWWLVSATSVALMAVFFVASGSTAIDRMALYFIPLQLFVYGRLPQLGVVASESTARSLVYGYAFAVMFVWLFFATHARYWLPYRMYGF